jgi:hypothetical protein
MTSIQSHPLTPLEEPFRAKKFVPWFGAWIYCFAIWIGMGACFAQLNTLPETQGNLKQHQIAFLKRIRKADPQHQTIERAVFNQQNELGLILNRSVEMDKVSALMRSMLVQMAREFPNQDLTVLAYTPSNPPRKIGTARLNARTRDMTYTPEY